MQTYEKRIYLQDECPRLGSGWRTLFVRKGRKWAYLSDRMGRKQRVTLKLLAEIMGEEEDK